MAERRLEETVGRHNPSCTEILANTSHSCHLSFYGVQNKMKAQPSFARKHVKMGRNASGSALLPVKS